MSGAYFWQQIWQHNPTEGRVAVSIHKRIGANGKNTFRVMWRDADGVQRSKSFKSQTEAKSFNAEVVLGRTPLRRVSDNKTTVKSWIEEWFATYSSEWRVTTIRQRGNICDKWIVPMIGHKPLAGLTGRSVRMFRQDMLEDGASNNTANSVMSVLSAALTAAAEQGVIDQNPARGIRRLAVRKSAADALTPTEVEEYRFWMPTSRDRLIVSLVAYAGLRPAEVCGLQWKHVRANHILVEQSAQDHEIVPTKTGKTRIVELCDALRDEIDAYRPVDADAEDLVITGERGGILNWKNWFRRVWSEAGDHVGYNFRPYDLRHTFASLQIHSGKNVMQVAGELGHANPTMTLNVYGHVFTESQVQSRVSVDDAIRAARTELAARPPRSQVRLSAAPSEA